MKNEIDYLKKKIVDVVMETYKNENIAILATFLLNFAQLEIRADGTYKIMPEHKQISAIGLCLADPVTMAVQACFTIVGPMWPKVLNGIIDDVNKAWLKYRKELKVLKKEE